MRWPLTCMALGLLGGCSGDSNAVLRFVGLTHAPCKPGGQVLFGKVPLRLALDGGELARVSVTINEAAPLVDETAPFQVELDTTKLPNATARLAAQGTDRAGSSTRAAIEVCVDNAGPTLDILSPADGATVGLEDAALPVRVLATHPLTIERIVASLDLAGAHHEKECTPPTGPDAVCAMEPSTLGVKLAAGAVADLTLSVVARDSVGHETRVRRTLKLRTRLIWAFDAAGPISSAGAALAGGGVAVGTEKGLVVVLDAAGRELCRWQAPKPKSGDSDAVTTPLTLSADGKSLFFGTRENLWCLDPTAKTTCAVRWTQPGLFYGSRPVLSASGTLLVGRLGEAGSRGTLRALNPATGAQLGSIDITVDPNEWVTGTPALSASGTTVYIGTAENNTKNNALHAIDVSTPSAMKKLWAFPAATKIETRPLVTGDRIYVAAFDPVLHALDPASGAKSSAFYFKAEAPFFADPVAAADGTLYVASLDEHLYHVDTGGKELGKTKVGRLVRVAPAIGPGGAVFAARNKPGRLHALSAKLETQWLFDPDKTEEFKATPVIEGTTLYIGNSNGFIYALDVTPPSS